MERNSLALAFCCDGKIAGVIPAGSLEAILSSLRKLKVLAMQLLAQMGSYVINACSGRVLVDLNATGKSQTKQANYMS